MARGTVGHENVVDLAEMLLVNGLSLFPTFLREKYKICPAIFGNQYWDFSEVSSLMPFDRHCSDYIYVLGRSCYA